MAQRVIDLSLPIQDNMLMHPLLGKPYVIPYQTHENTRSFGFGTPEDPVTGAMQFIGMLDGTGTHVDAFFHNNPDGQTVDEMPIEMFFGPAVCLDLTDVPDFGTIDVAEIEAAQAMAGVEVDGHIVLLNTGLHARHFPRVEVATNQPFVTPEVAHWLADRGVKVFGVEGPSTDPSTNTLFANHRACRDRGITHYEWLVNLEQLVGAGEFTFFGVPLAIKGSGQGPCRAFATLDD